MAFHTCDVCGKRGEWTESWWWYGKLMDWQHEESILIMCSRRCKEKIADPKKALADKIAGRLWTPENINWERGLKLVR